MDDFNKVSSTQLYGLWKNLSTSLLVIIVLVALTRLLPFYLAPVFSLSCAAYIYYILYNHRNRKSKSCIITLYVFFYCIISYSFVSIVINALYAWGALLVPRELLFFNEPYIITLVLMPVCFLTIVIMYIRRRRLGVCIDCKLKYGDSNERGTFGYILENEIAFQFRNLMLLFGVTSVLIWVYYLLFYINISQNARDWYIFTWMVVIAFVFDELYFMGRYYNLYLQLKEENDIITPEDFSRNSATSNVRFYVVCGNNIFLNKHAVDPHLVYREVIDTPFTIVCPSFNLTVSEMRRAIEKMTGIKGGELKFFFGRRHSDFEKSSMLRYFYFVVPSVNQNGEKDCKEGEDCPVPENVKGEWIDFNVIRRIYTENPSVLSPTLLADISRLSTIVVTRKTFDERGFRRNKLKSYTPTFSLEEVRDNDIDFQDDKWIRISLFNSDTSMYRLRRWMRNLFKAGKGVDGNRDNGVWQ